MHKFFGLISTNTGLKLFWITDTTSDTQVNVGTTISPSGRITDDSHIICLGNNYIEALYCAEDVDTSSDGRDKTDVEDFTAGLDWIEAMRPVTYHWDKRSWYSEYAEETGKLITEGTPDGTHKKDKKHK